MRLIHEVSPYEGFDAASRPLDLQGWASNSPVFDQLIREYRPSLIVEVGSWKGASAIHMAERLKAHGISGTILCVDTWLGSRTIYSNPEIRSSLKLTHGFPTVYYTFLANVIKTGHTDVILPMPLPSLQACRWLKLENIVPDLVYIDADHEGPGAFADISNYWEIVSPKGAIFGDDYLKVWPGVVEAVTRFAKKISVTPEIRGEKWIMRKNGHQADLGIGRPAPRERP